MPTKAIRLLATTLGTFAPKRNEFVVPLICIEGKWYQISKQLFVQEVLLGQQQRLDRLLHKEKPANAAQRVVSKMLPDLSVKYFIPTQKAYNFGGSAPKRYHWPVAADLDISYKELPEDIKGKLRILGEISDTTRAEKILLSITKKEFEPRLKNLKNLVKVAATEAA